MQSGRPRFMHTHIYACMGGTHPYRDKLQGMYKHTLTKRRMNARSLSHTQCYPNSDSWAEGHYGFGCQWRASSMNCSDQRNATLISPICAWPYIYITFQHSLSEVSRNLGQHWGKCKRGQAEQQESGAEWRMDWFLWWSWPQLFSRRLPGRYEFHMYSVWKRC